MDFIKFFARLKPRISWYDDIGFHYCEGCGREMDLPEKELHWPVNCSLSKLKKIKKIRTSVIAANPEQYQKYCESKGVKVNLNLKPIDPNKEFPIGWYKNQLDNYAKLPMNLGEPSGAEVIEAPPIPLRKLTAEDLIPKICKKKIIKTGDPIIDSLPMRDMPFRDLDGHILSYEELDELEKQEKEGKNK